MNRKMKKLLIRIFCLVWVVALCLSCAATALAADEACPYCGKDVPEGIVICPHCWVCTECGAQNNENAVVCVAHRTRGAALPAALRRAVREKAPEIPPAVPLRGILPRRTATVPMPVRPMEPQSGLQSPRIMQMTSRPSTWRRFTLILISDIPTFFATLLIFRCLSI